MFDRYNPEEGVVIWIDDPREIGYNYLTTVRRQARRSLHPVHHPPETNGDDRACARCRRRRSPSVARCRLLGSAPFL